MLDINQIRQYEGTGALLLKGVFGQAEIGVLRDAADRVAKQDRPNFTPEADGSVARTAPMRTSQRFRPPMPTSLPH